VSESAERSRRLGRMGVHLLASSRGYRTIAASAEVTAAEKSALEALVFGQSSDAGYLASLESEPAAFVRMLPAEGGAAGASGAVAIVPARIALTRVFAGRLDDAGRATLELRTLLLEPPDYERLVRSALAHAIRDDRLWDRRRFESGRTIDAAEALAHGAGSGASASTRGEGASTHGVGRDELLMMDAWLRVLESPQSTAVLADGAEARRAILSFLGVLSSADLARCRWGLRLLSLATEPHLATAPPTLDRGRRTVMPIDLRAEPAFESVRFLLRGAGSMDRLPFSEILRTGAARSHGDPRSHGATDAPARVRLAHGSDPGRAPFAARSRWTALLPMLVAIGLLALAVAIVAIVGISFWSSVPGAPEPVSGHDGLERPSRPSFDRTPRPRNDAAVEPPNRPGQPQATGQPKSSATGPAARPSSPPESDSGATAPKPVPVAPANTAPANTAPVNTTPANTAPAPGASPQDAPSTPPPSPTPAAPGESNPTPGGEQAPPTQTLTERIAEEREAARRAVDTLVERTHELQAALDGPSPDQRWGDPFDRWSAEHCQRVIAAFGEFDSALRLLPIVWNSEELVKITDARRAEDWSNCELFAKRVPLVAGGLECLTMIAEEPFRNAIVTRANALAALQRSRCQRTEIDAADARTRDLFKALRPFIGMGRRPDAATISGMSSRLRASISLGRDRCGDTLDPAEVRHIDELTRPPPPTP